jgi:hypothetical protein
MILRWTEIVFISDDGQKDETCSKIRVYGISIQIIVLTEPNNIENFITNNVMHYF